VSIFDRGSKTATPVADLVKKSGVRELKVGSHVWWRGMRLEVTIVYPNGKFTFTNGYFRNTSLISSTEWSDAARAFILPGTAGIMPKTVRGEFIDPPIPTCEVCGEVSWRVNVCTNCRLDGHGGTE